ncbi:MAG TPA: hypothetical protein ENN13_01180 [Candidatus Altiarchaeales archaeon]|nr:hypothetical protein [Candidatus Altiarchaeales archaeon]
MKKIFRLLEENLKISSTILASYLALIFWMSHQSVIPEEISWMNVCSILHILEYMALGFLATPVFMKISRRYKSSAIVFSTAYGISDELHQHFIPGRTASLWDVLLDSLGAVFGVHMYVLLRNHFLEH